MTYDDWKTRTPDDSDERCVRDDSNECDCSRCQADGDLFWDEFDAEEADRLSKEVPLGVDLDYVRKAIPDLCDQAAELDELLIAVRDLIVAWDGAPTGSRSEEHTSELQS